MVSTTRRMAQEVPTAPDYRIFETASPEQTARWLGVTVETLANWRYRGEGPPFLKIGRTVRYRVRDLESWYEERTRNAAGL